MGEAKHTPGPFAVGPTHRESEGKTWLTFSYQAAVEHPNGLTDLAVVDVAEEEGEANARLFAAAPDLLAACVEAAEHGRHPESCGWWDKRHPQALMHDVGVCDCYLSRLRAAIAKAEGRT